MPPLNPYIAPLLPQLPKPLIPIGNQAVNAGLPALSPEDQDSMLSQLGGSVLSGVSTASNALDTATGGRWVRNALGLLTGNDKASFGELFTPSLLGNLTDAIGLTSYDNAVQPEDLTGSDNFLTNFAVGAALDPGTYLSGGMSALGKAGKLAKSAGILDDAAIGLAKQMGRKIGTVGPRLARTQGTLRTTLGAIDDPIRRATAMTNLTQNATKQGLNLADMLDQPLGGLMRGKLPFMPEKLFGTGQGVADLAESLDSAGRWVSNLPGVRNARALLDKSVGGATSALGQAIGRISHRGSQLAEEKALGDVSDIFSQIKSGKLTPEDLGMNPTMWRDDVRRILEGYQPQNLNPQAASQLTSIAQQMKQGLDDQAWIKMMGGDTGEWLSNYGSEYFPRQSILPDVPDTKGGGGAFGRRAVPTSDKFMKERNELFDVPGGTATINAITRDPELVGRTRGLTPGTVPAMDNAAAATKIRRNYLGISDSALQDMYDARQAIDAGDIATLRNQFPQYKQLPDPDFMAEVAKDVGKQETLVARSGKLAEEVGGYHPWYAESGRGLFDQDPLESLMQYRVSHAAVRHGISTTHDVLADWASEIMPGQWPTHIADAEQTMGKFFGKQATRDPGDFYVRLTDALDQAGIGTEQGKAFQAAKLSQKLGRPINADDMANMYVPRDVVEPLTRTMKAFRQPDEVSAFFSAANKFTNLFKTYATLRPSFFTRNLMSGSWTNYVLDGSDPRFGKLDYRHWLQPYADARTLVKGGVIKDAATIPMFEGKGLTDAQATDEIRKLVFGKRVAGSFASQAGEIIGGTGDFAGDVARRIPGEIPTPSMTPWAVAGRSIPKTLDEVKPWNVAGVGSLGGDIAPYVREGRNLNQYVEDLNRISPFIAKLRQGIDASEAARSVRVAHVDYQALTAFEKKYAKSLIPFYTYTRQVLPWLIKDIVQNPGGANRQALRLLDEARGEGFLPDYLAQSSAIPLPDWVAGESDTGSKKYLTGFDLPVEQLNLLSTGPGLFSTIKATGNNLIGMANPLLKTGAELVTGRSFFQQGRPLEDLEPTLGRLAANAGLLNDPREIRQIMGGSLGSPLADELIAMSPIAPTLSIAKQIGDSRKGVLSKAVNIATGARVSDVDMERQKSLQARKLLEEQLRGKPGIGTYEHFYAQPGAIEKMTPEEQRMFALYRQLSNEAAKKAREKKKAG